jgi:flagellar protein FliL
MKAALARAIMWAAVLSLFCAVSAPAVQASEKKPDKGGAAPGAPVGPPYFLDLPDMLINLNSPSKRPAFLKMKMAIEVAEAGHIDTVKHVMPLVLDGVQMYLRELRPEQLSGSVGMYRLRQDLITRISAPSYPAKVKDVLFKEMLVQ